MELLHEVDALVAVATELPEPARSWACRLLAVWAPERVPALPTTRGPALAVAASLPRDATVLTEPADLDAPGSLAILAAALRLGRLDPASEAVQAWRPRLEAGLGGTPDPADPWRAWLLALTGSLPAAALPALVAAEARAPEGRWLGAAVLLQHAAATGAGPDVAPAAMAPLRPWERLRTLRALGAGLWAPPDSLAGAEAAATAGLTLAGDSGSLPPVRGARRRRLVRLVDTLLDDRDTPLAHALRAALPTDSPGLEGVVLCEAAWRHAFALSDDPAHDVRSRGGHRLPALLRAAAADGPALLDALSAALGGEHPPLTSAPEGLLDRALATGPDALAGLAPAFAPRLAPLLPEALHAPHTRDRALQIAAACPTLPVLEALLDLPIPMDPVARQHHVDALGAMGDPVVAGHLDALADEADVRAGRALLASLHPA
jgi:hypothetical protein